MSADFTCEVCGNKLFKIKINSNGTKLFECNKCGRMSKEEYDEEERIWRFEHS
jgi:hypothetical protein